MNWVSHSILIAWTISVGIAPSVADVPLWDCRALYSRVLPHESALDKSSTFEEIATLFGKRSIAPVDPGDLQARVNRIRTLNQRFIEPQFDRGAGALTDEFTRFSGYLPPAGSEKIPAMDYIKAFRDWSGAAAFVDADADRIPLSVGLLKEIHRRASANLEFRGYEGRRIAKRLRHGEIDRATFRSLLDRAYHGESISGVNHRSLVGRFRSEDLDQLSHHGSTLDRSGRRYFTPSEFDGLSKNPMLTLVPGSFRRDGDGLIRAEFRYLDVSRVEEAVKRIIERTNRQLQQATTLEEKVRSIVTMQRDLISSHPFLDGNGRTIRLVTDLMYHRIGLPYPARPNERDLEMPIEESVRFVREQMVKTLQETAGRDTP